MDFKFRVQLYLEVPVDGLPAYHDMSLRVVTSTGNLSTTAVFKFSISLIFLVLVKFN
eukprot:SAG31_NODE_2385_length_5819_cov_3.572902_1_plen_57_part_00